jgi:hypothetical protein
VKSSPHRAAPPAEVIGRFAGRVRETTASGSFRTRVRGPRDRCDLAPQTWTAATG